MRKIFLVVFTVCSMMLIPNVVLAKKDSIEELKKLSETVKYYKTMESRSIQQLNANSLNNSYTTEISKEEYDSATNTDSINTSIETNYKKMTTTIYQNGSYYRYQTRLEWKTMPKMRSYDIIAIGINPSVSIASSISFNQYYCFNNGECKNNSAYYSKSTVSGGGASFKLPTGDLKVLNSTIYFDVKKNVNATILKQDAYGDYAHATSSVSNIQSQAYTINTLGINLNNSISNLYDNIPVAQATWNGNW